MSNSDHACQIVSKFQRFISNQYCIEKHRSNNRKHPWFFEQVKQNPYDLELYSLKINLLFSTKNYQQWKRSWILHWNKRNRLIYQDFCWIYFGKWFEILQIYVVAKRGKKVRLKNWSTNLDDQQINYCIQPKLSKCIRKRLRYLHFCSIKGLTDFKHRELSIIGIQLNCLKFRGIHFNDYINAEKLRRGKWVFSTWFHIGSVSENCEDTFQ